jgi:hypothetical protein
MDEPTPFAFSNRELEGWRALLKEVGFAELQTEYWGFPFFGAYQGPLAILVYKKCGAGQALDAVRCVGRPI